jgi:hypothetical protein
VCVCVYETQVRVVDLPHKPEVYEFELVLPDRVLRLRPKSESQRRHWVAAIQKMRSLAGCACPYRAGLAWSLAPYVGGGCAGGMCACAHEKCTTADGTRAARVEYECDGARDR